MDTKKKPTKRAWARYLSLLMAFVAPSVAGARQVANAEPLLDLTVAVAEALARNPEIQMVQQRLAIATARARQTTYLEDPQIAFQLGGVPLSNPTSFNQADTNSIGIRQMVPFFGKLALREQIARQETKVVEQELRGKETEVAAMVKTAYADLFMAERAVEILRDQREIMRMIIGATEARYRVGKVTQQDVFKAQLEQSEIMNQLIVAEEESKAATVKLNTAMYRPPQTPIRIPADLTLPDIAAAAYSLDEMALANRPELRAAQEEIGRSERMYELANRNRKFPDFMLGWDYMRMPTEMKKKDRYAAMVNVTIPFSPWSMGRHNDEVEESLAEIRAAKSNLDAMRNTTLKQVGESLAKVEAARRSIQLYREGLLSQADLSFRSSLVAYQTGRVEFVNLLEAERGLRQAHMGYYKATTSFLKNLADLERAVGRELQ